MRVPLLIKVLELSYQSSRVLFRGTGAETQGLKHAGRSLYRMSPGVRAQAGLTFSSLSTSVHHYIQPVLRGFTVNIIMPVCFKVP